MSQAPRSFISEAPPASPWYREPGHDAPSSPRMSLALPRDPHVRSPSPAGTLGVDAVAPSYFPDQHATWRELCAHQAELVRGRASKVFLQARENFDVSLARIPELRHLDNALFRNTGWHVVKVDGYVRPAKFFRMLANRCFPCMDLLRHQDELLYSPEPDMFHDVMGHLPVLGDPILREYYYLFGKVGTRAETPQQVASLDKIYWFTMEFGMLEEEGVPRAYGAALLTGLKELADSGGASVQRVPFDIDELIQTPTDVHKINEKIFVVPSLELMFGVFEDWARAERLL
jgi:phenylalanine-4-hydroxylase